MREQASQQQRRSLYSSLSDLDKFLYLDVRVFFMRVVNQHCLQINSRSLTHSLSLSLSPSLSLSTNLSVSLSLPLSFTISLYLYFPLCSCSTHIHTFLCSRVFSTVLAGRSRGEVPNKTQLRAQGSDKSLERSTESWDLSCE